MTNSTNREAPSLTPATFEILLALADQERHGYGIMREVERRTEGELNLDQEPCMGPLSVCSRRALLRSLETDRIRKWMMIDAGITD